MRDGGKKRQGKTTRRMDEDKMGREGERKGDKTERRYDNKFTNKVYPR